MLRSDRSVLELLTADYTFLNERLAMHYGIETVKGSHFRRVTLDDPARYGLLGKGAILMLTAYPNRTRPCCAAPGSWTACSARRRPTPPLERPDAAGEQARPAGANAAGAGSSSTARIRRASPVTA